ncbi:hypothetical protein BJY04DRAFT_215856 [Aspergillus karnatakaensis]|uniref:Zn(II)2Cys6 transcription factor domain-containing protein n=1 Tax=Aspergillus karnatakaensis TaxID=1810916 RepID=UPI003CCD2542
MTSTANNACLSCALKKRRCDRILPTCSTCERLNQQCWYRPAKHGYGHGHSHSHEGLGAILPIPAGKDQDEKTSGLALKDEELPPDTSLFPPHSRTQLAIRSLTRDVGRVVAACLGCRSRKRKCDKALPSCGRCASHKIRCVYPQQNSAAGGGGGGGDPDGAFLHCLDLKGVVAKVPLPVRSRPYMPLLLHSFIETMGMDPLPVDKDSLAWHLKATWIQQALSDPCAFHTTLYAASAHLDAFRGTRDNRMTLYHHGIALHLLNERLRVQKAVYSESIMACVAPLVYFSSIGEDKVSSQIHKKALSEMIRAKGGFQNISADPFLAGLIAVCAVSEAVINDSGLDIPFLDIPPTTASPPSYLISAALWRAESKKGYYNLPPEAIRILKDMEFVTKYYTDPTSTDSSLSQIHQSWRTALEHALSPSDSDTSTTQNTLKTEDPDPEPLSPTPTSTSSASASAITASCHAAALIFIYLLPTATQNTSSITLTPPSSLPLLANRLKTALFRVSMDTWIRTAPEAHSWICMLGAAASDTRGDRIFYCLRQGQPVTCLGNQGITVSWESWRLFEWAGGRRKSMEAGRVVLDDDDCACGHEVQG